MVAVLVKGKANGGAFRLLYGTNKLRFPALSRNSVMRYVP
jgi:hypothetical protein